MAGLGRGPGCARSSGPSSAALPEVRPSLRLLCSKLESRAEKGELKSPERQRQERANSRHQCNFWERKVVRVPEKQGVEEGKQQQGARGCSPRLSDPQTWRRCSPASGAPSR